ncbi:MAG: tetratricopeptide repeat protein [Bacteroidales bacterium]
MSKKLFVFIKKFAVFIIKSSGLLLLLCLAISFQQCSSPEHQKTTDARFDSLAVKVNLQLKTNADSAVFTSKILNDYAIATNDEAQLFTSSYLRGRSLEFAGKIDSAVVYYNKMLYFAIQLNDTNKILRSYNALGSVFVEAGSNDTVAFFYRKGIELARLSKDTIQLANFMTNMGLYYEECNKIDSAMISYTMGLQFYEKEGDSIEMAVLYGNLGNLFLTQNLPQKSIVEHSKALAINQRLKKMLEVGHNYNNLALAYKHINNDSVYFYFQKAILIFSESGSITDLMMAKFNYANYLKRMGKTNEAENIYLEVLEISTKNNILKGRIYSLSMLAKIQGLKNKLQNANKYFDEALSLAVSNKQTQEILLLYRNIFENNLSLHNSEVAMKYFTLWNQLNDSLQTKSQNDAIVKYHTLYETQKKELTITALEKENEINKTKSSLLRYILILSLLGVLVLLYSFWLHTKNAKHKLAVAVHRQNAQDLELSNKELIIITQEQEAVISLQERDSNQQLLVSKMLLLSQHNEFMSHILCRLQVLNQKLSTQAEQDDLHEILNSLQSQLQTKKWEDFQQQYLKAHEEFFVKLNEVHPNLTAGENRLCTLIRMNLRVKEIADLTMQPQPTVEMARYRLRTKLGLIREENLRAYLSKF